MPSNRFCVFCGNTPENKNKEHILPQWLLKLTGDPKRVVDFGINYENGSKITFDWSSFCAPACKSCNEEFSDLEVKAKSYMIRLLKRESLSSIEYSDFMDWLDKVRIGIWLTYHSIQKNPTNIKPALHIKNRICQKDRMIAIYPMEGNDKGLNAFGVESMIFHSQPSCFALRVNNLFIFNISSDYLFATRCGFPFPKTRYTKLDGENIHKMHLEDFHVTRRVKHPLIRSVFAKPSIHLYQPIMPRSDNKLFQSGFLGNFSCFDSYLYSLTIPPHPSGKGKLFFQHQDRVEPFFETNKPIEFESINNNESKSMKVLKKQVYEFQNILYEKEEFRSSNKQILKNHNERTKILIKYNKLVLNSIEKQ